MQPLTQQKLAGNAYRTLGLSAGAGQAAIEAAARRMRIWPDAKRIPPTPWDLPALGPISRTRGDLDQALAALTEPASRVEERLLWYLSPTPPTGAPAAAGEAEAETYPPDRRHDAALAALHAAWAEDPEVADAPRWQLVLQQLDELATAHDFAAWLTRVEADGDFEKRAAADEIRAALHALPGALAAALVPKAQAALDRGDVAAGAGIAAVLRTAEPAGGGAVSGHLRGLLDRLEDALAADCREIDRELRDKLRTHPEFPEHFFGNNAQAARLAAKAYNARLRPALERMQTLATWDAERQLRCRSRAGEVLGLVGIAWEWAGRFDKAEQTLTAALELASGTQAEPAIRRDLARCAALAEAARAPRQQHRFAVASNTFVYNETQTGVHDTDAPSAKTRAGGRGVPPPQWEGQSVGSSYPTRRKPASKGSGGGWAATVIAIMVIRGIIMLANQSSSSSSTPYRPSWEPNARLERLQMERLQKQFAPTSPGETRDEFGRVVPPKRPGWVDPGFSGFSLNPPAPPGPSPTPSYPNSPSDGYHSSPGVGGNRGR